MKITLSQRAVGTCLPVVLGAGAGASAPTTASHRGTGASAARRRADLTTAPSALVPAATGFDAAVGSPPPRGAPV